MLHPSQWEENRRKPNEQPKLTPEVKQIYLDAFKTGSKEEKISALKELQKDMKITSKIVGVTARALATTYIYCTLSISNVKLTKQDLLGMFDN